VDGCVYEVQVVAVLNAKAAAIPARSSATITPTTPPPILDRSPSSHPRIPRPTAPGPPRVTAKLRHPPM
jgi:hypothetical protein